MRVSCSCDYRRIGTVWRVRCIPVKQLKCGDVGYFAGSIKELTRFVGDTLTTAENPASEPLPGYKEALPMVFSGLYPVDNEDYAKLIKDETRRFGEQLKDSDVDAMSFKKEGNVKLNKRVMQAKFFDRLTDSHKR